MDVCNVYIGILWLCFSAHLLTAHHHFHCATVALHSEAGSPFSSTVPSFFLRLFLQYLIEPVVKKKERLAQEL